MKKVIMKCKLKNRDEFEKRLTDIDLDFGPVYWQHDRVYVPRGYKRTMNLPRLVMRTEMKALDRPARYEVILKRHIEDSGVEIVDRTVVKDYTEMVNIIHQLGFEKRAEISRRRQDIIMGEGTRLFLDKVDGTAGYYAKIEADLSENDKVQDVTNDLLKTFEILGQSEHAITREAYFEISERENGFGGGKMVD